MSSDTISVMRHNNSCGKTLLDNWVEEVRVKNVHSMLSPGSCFPSMNILAVYKLISLCCNSSFSVILLTTYRDNVNSMISQMKLMFLSFINKDTR